MVMPYRASSLPVCLVFSQAIKSALFSTWSARIVMSAAWPMGVATMYRPAASLLVGGLSLLSMGASAVRRSTERDFDCGKFFRGLADFAPRLGDGLRGIVLTAHRM